MKETNYLSLEQLKRLLSYISGKAYELAIWLGVYLGLRVGEIQALRWQDVDFEKQLIHIRRTNLSHSTSELYMAHGATRDDLRILFAHSAASVTDRYIHDRGSRLEKVAQQIRLFPSGTKWAQLGSNQQPPD